ncbi:MAG: DUF2334 domain-containing protein [Verrucomicrobiota bacterium]
MGLLGARYLVRFDDICPTLNWEVWDPLESILEKLNIQPLLAVVPDNQDPALMVSPPASDFWERVRGWQKKGWSIGLHGWQHVYRTAQPGLVGINPFSEFAGVEPSAQAEMIQRGHKVLQEHGIVPQLWIAPGHSFDRHTIKALLLSGIKILSDGLFPFVATDPWGMTWIPQQLWRFRAMPMGTWTVCCHINSWTTRELRKFHDDCQRFHHRMSDLPQAVRDAVRSPWALQQACFGNLLRAAVALRARRGKSDPG